MKKEKKSVGKMNTKERIISAVVITLGVVCVGLMGFQLLSGLETT